MDKIEDKKRGGTLTEYANNKVAALELRIQSIEIIKKRLGVLVTQMEIALNHGNDSRFNELEREFNAKTAELEALEKEFGQMCEKAGLVPSVPEEKK